MDEELISIIIPVYNIEKYLPRCLETIAAQSYRNLEIILVDDGSTDKSGEICDEYVEKDKRACVIHQRNQGLWAARNNGQRIAKGNYLMFVDGDDYMDLDAITTLYQAINHVKQYDIAIIDYKKTNQKQYGHYLLSYLYKQMVFWKNRNYRKIDEPVVFKQCNEYETATRKAYWLNWRINPLEKIVVTTLLHSPRLTRWLMKITKNY